MITTTDQESDLKAEILKTVNEIFKLFDAEEWGKLRSLFMDEVEFYVEAPSGTISAKFLIDDLINLWKSKFDGVRKSYHQLADQIVELNDGVASAFTKSYNFHRLEDSDKQEFWEMWTDYTHHLVKTEDGWKCNGIKMIVPAQSANGDVKEFFPKSEDIR